MSTILVTLAFPSGGRVKANMVAVPPVGDAFEVCGAHYRVQAIAWTADVVTPWSLWFGWIPTLRGRLGVVRPGATVHVVADS